MRVTGHGTGQKKVSDCAGRLEKVFDNGARSPAGQMVNALRRRWVDDYCRPVSIKDLEQRFEIGCSQIDPAVVSKKTDSGSASLGERPLRLSSGRSDIRKRKTGQIGESPGVPAHDVVAVLVDASSHQRRLGQSADPGTGQGQDRSIQVQFP